MSGRDVRGKLKSEIKINGKYGNIECSFDNTDLKEIHLTEKKIEETPALHSLAGKNIVVKPQNSRLLN